VPADHGGKRLAVLQHHRIHVIDAGAKRRVVQGDQRRDLRRLAEPRIEPGELLRAEPAGRIAGDQTVQADQAHRAEVDRKAKRPGGREQLQIGERSAHQLAIVVIPG
jgi:hypothetical protein